MPGQPEPKAPLDQFGTFEVFVQPKEGKPFQHEGIVHAPNLEMAWVLAKETFTRRFLCASLSVVDTRNVYVSATTEGDQSAYDCLAPAIPTDGERVSFEIYHLLKRGKQHVHAGSVLASSPADAMNEAGKSLRPEKPVYNIWAIPTAAFRFTTQEERDLWNTLPEKKFRDASDYKGGEKLKSFIEKSRTQ